MTLADHLAPLGLADGQQRGLAVVGYPGGDHVHLRGGLARRVVEHAGADVCGKPAQAGGVRIVQCPGAADLLEMWSEYLVVEPLLAHRPYARAALPGRSSCAQTGRMIAL